MKLRIQRLLGRTALFTVPAFLVAAGILVSFAEVSSDLPRISNVWPLSVVERLTENRTFTHSLPPFFTKTSKPEGEQHTLRPLVTTVKDNLDGDVTVDVLPPFVHATHSATERSFNFFPLITHRAWVANDGSKHGFSSFLPVYHHRVDGAEHQTAVFPIYMSGTAGPVSYPIPYKSTRNYTAIFPIYGNLYGAFGNDRVSFALWPIYTRIEKRGRGPGALPDPFVKHQFFWPILTIGNGGGYKSFKIWPIYGRTEKAGQYVSQFVAWPIFNFTKSVGGDTKSMRDVTTGFPMYWDITEGSKRAHSLFPFYGKRTTPDMDRSFQMWPLYINTKYTKEGYRTKDYLWPVFSRTEGSQTGYKFWPLFGVKKKKEIRAMAKSGNIEEEDLSAFYFWTLGKYERAVRKDSRRVYNRFFPLYIYGRYDDSAGYRQRQFFLWPIISYQEDSLQGVKAVSFLNLLGTLEAQFPQIQEVYSPLWRVVDYARQGDESRLSILWNLVDVRKDRGQVAMSVGPVFSFHRNERGVQEYTILSSLHIRNRGTVRDESLNGQAVTRRTESARMPSINTRSFNRNVSAAWSSGVDWVKKVGARVTTFLSALL